MTSKVPSLTPSLAPAAAAEGAAKKPRPPIPPLCFAGRPTVVLAPRKDVAAAQFQSGSVLSAAGHMSAAAATAATKAPAASAAPHSEPVVATDDGWNPDAEFDRIAARRDSEAGYGVRRRSASVLVAPPVTKASPRDFCKTAEKVAGKATAGSGSGSGSAGSAAGSVVHTPSSGDEEPRFDFATEQLSRKFDALFITQLTTQMAVAVINPEVEAKIKAYVEKVQHLTGVVGMVGMAVKSEQHAIDDLQDALSNFDSGHSASPEEVSEANMWTAKKLIYELSEQVERLATYKDSMTPAQREALQKATVRIDGAIERTKKPLDAKSKQLASKYKPLFLVEAGSHGVEKAKKAAHDVAGKICDFRLYTLGLSAHLKLTEKQALEKKVELLREIAEAFWLPYQTMAVDDQDALRNDILLDLAVEGELKNLFLGLLIVKNSVHTLDEIDLRTKSVELKPFGLELYAPTSIAWMQIATLTKSLSRLYGFVDIFVNEEQIVKRQEKDPNVAADAKVDGEKSQHATETIAKLLVAIRKMMGWPVLHAFEVNTRAAALGKADNPAIEGYQPFQPLKDKAGTLLTHPSNTAPVLGLVEANRDILVLKFLTKEMAALGITAIYGLLYNYSMQQKIGPELRYLASGVDQARSIHLTKSEKPGREQWLHVRAELELPIRQGSSRNPKIASLALFLDFEVEMVAGIPISRTEVTFTRLLPPQWDEHATPLQKRQILEALDAKIPLGKVPDPATATSKK